MLYKRLEKGSEGWGGAFKKEGVLLVEGWCLGGAFDREVVLLRKRGGMGIVNRGVVLFRKVILTEGWCF